MTHIERLQQQGIRRLRDGKRRFRYRTAGGRRIRRAELLRIASLRIPPAWKSVAINEAPGGRVQAIGKDAAGRWQYLYHADYLKAQQRQKYERLTHFGSSLPAMRQTINKHLGSPDLSRERVLACVLKILTLSFLRPGSEVYANEHGSYGITTLRSRHVKVRGNLLVFDFCGKSGVRQHRELRSRKAAQVVKELLKLPGSRIFKFRNGGGTICNVTPRHINAYIKEVMGDRFTAKDFRTWAGTLICASELSRIVADDDGTVALKKSVRRALEETANALGNTPAVCRTSYVCPSILEAFEKGRVISPYFKSVDELAAYRGASLHPVEKALVRFLKSEGKS